MLCKECGKHSYVMYIKAEGVSPICGECEDARRERMKKVCIKSLPQSPAAARQANWVRNERKKKKDKGI